MARMYPHPIRPETQSVAERKVYTACERQLPDTWHVFHGARWLVRDRHAGARDGETDFVIAVPDRGLIVLEVKGGNIRHSGKEDQWYSNNLPIKNPFVQAAAGMRNLMYKMREMPTWSVWPIPYISRAVAFPDVPVDGDLAPDAPRAIILGRRDLACMEDWCLRVLHYYDAQTPMTRGEMDALVDLLAPSRTLRCRMVDEMAQERERIVELTEEQYGVLDLLRHQRRVAVSGCAGSGKTMLAMEQARRLARQGYRVLLTCYNRSLAEYMRQALGECDAVTVAHFHGLAAELAQAADLDTERPSDISEDEWYRVRVPELMLEAEDKLGPQYDAIVVDEGQDFCSNYWAPLMLLLHDADEGIYYLFYDDNQNLYVSERQLPEGLSPIALNANLRNTRSIHNSFLPFYASEAGDLPEARGPEGRPVEVTYYASYDELESLLRRTLHRLTADEGVPLQDIVILTPYRNRGLLQDLPRLGNAQLVDELAAKPGQVSCSTIHSFKGLEKPVVVMTHLELSTHLDMGTLFYIGASRAKHHLIVLASETLPDEIRRRMPEEEAG